MGFNVLILAVLSLKKISITGVAKANWAMRLTCVVVDRRIVVDVQVLAGQGSRNFGNVWPSDFLG